MINIIENLEDLQVEIRKWIEYNFVEGLSGKKVFIKPNMGYPKPAPFTTSIEIISMVVKILTQLDVEKITIGEGSTSKTTAMDNFEETGLIKELNSYNVEFIDLNTLESAEVKLENGSTHYLPKLLKEFDIKISMPVIKYYTQKDSGFFLSNAVKNFFGIPPKDKYRNSEESHMRDRLHNDLHQSVAEIYLAVQKYIPFDLYVCDGTKTLIGEGSIGKEQEWGKIIIANDGISADLKVLELLSKPKPQFLQKLIEEKRTGKI